MPTCSLCSLAFEQRSCPNCGAIGTPSAPEPHPLGEDRAIANPDGPYLEGTVVAISPVAQLDAPANVWKWLVLFLAAASVFPLLIALYIISLALSFCLVTMLGLPAGRGGDRGSWSWLLAPRVLEGVLRRGAPVPVYVYRIETASGYQMARQEGEFADGCILESDHVRLWGFRRGGVLFIERGYNNSNGVQLTVRGNPWKGAFFIVFPLVAVEYATLLGLLAAQSGGIR